MGYCYFNTNFFLQDSLLLLITKLNMILMYQMMPIMVLKLTGNNKLQRKLAQRFCRNDCAVSIEVQHLNIANKKETIACEM